MRFASLGSGSAGNGLVVEFGGTTLLMDCGFGIKDSVNRLERLGLKPESLNGILVTHEHDDHAGGVFRLANKYRIPVWLTYGTYKMVERLLPEKHAIAIHVIDSHQLFSIGDIQVQPFPVPHDAREPVQYVFGDGDKKLGVLTDTGTSTPHIEAILNACDALLLECNHDLDMLMNGPYSWTLKQRVSSRLGHLDNQSSAGILARIDTSKLQHLIAAHLSAKNNSQALVKKALSQVLGCEENWIGIAGQELGFTWRQIT
ncbi:MAG TPA: MBL fold metallo-hydrolase [Methyloradius sp.]